MDFSGLAGALGAGFQGYAKDKEDELRRQALAAQLQGQDFDRTMRLREADYAPVSDVQSALKQATQGAGAAPAVGAVPGAATGFAPDAADMVQRLVAANQAKQLQGSVADQFTVPGQKEPWAPLPYDQTKVGLQQRKSLAVDAARQAAQTSRELAVKRETAQQASQQAAQERERRMAEIQSFDPKMPKERAAAIASDQKLFDAWGSQQFAPKAPKTPTTPQLKVSGDERKNAAFYANAKAANDILRGQTDLSLTDKAASHVPVVGNYFMSDEYQRMAQAAYQLSEAWLRATSGAAISENEIRRNAQNYFRQPGDSEATVIQKTKARERIVQSLKEMAGRAVDPNAAGSLDANPDLPYGGVILLKPGERPIGQP